jgi:hypothetical protein
MSAVNPQIVATTKIVKLISFPGERVLNTALA